MPINRGFSVICSVLAAISSSSSADSSDVSESYRHVIFAGDWHRFLGRRDGSSFMRKTVRFRSATTRRMWRWTSLPVAPNNSVMPFAPTITSPGRKPAWSPTQSMISVVNYKLVGKLLQLTIKYSLDLDRIFAHQCETESAPTTLNFNL